MNVLVLATATGETYGVNLAEVLFSASAMVQAVLWLLVGMSVGCWFIIGFKWYTFRRAHKANLRFLDGFYAAKGMEGGRALAEGEPFSPAARVFLEAHRELVRLQESEGTSGMLRGFENVERSVRRATQEQVTLLERLVPFLATTGSTAPFIGLFGTVWGIVEAFDAIPRQSGGVILDKVAGPMAHALIATAVGLLAAIPAVMAYNFFVRKIKLAVSEVDSFSSEFLNIARRHHFKG
jgi:biopolymer transport protein TolQ